MTNCSREVESLLFKCVVKKCIEFSAIFFYNFLVIDQEVDTLIRRFKGRTVESRGTIYGFGHYKFTYMLCL